MILHPNLVEMKIIINSAVKEVNDNSNLIEILSELNLINKSGFAVAVNNKVIPKNNWSDFDIKEMDNVLIIKASQGG